MTRLDLVDGTTWKYLFWSDGTIVGGANLAPSGYLWGVWIAESYRRQGFGMKLVGAMVEEAASQGHCWVRLRVHVGNRPAAGLYRKFGFRPVGGLGQDINGAWQEYELELG